MKYPDSITQAVKDIQNGKYTVGALSSEIVRLVNIPPVKKIDKVYLLQTGKIRYEVSK